MLPSKGDIKQQENERQRGFVPAKCVVHLRASAWLKPLQNSQSRFLGGCNMSPEERKRLNTLCRRIKDEEDPRVFSMLLKELDELLGATREPPPPHPKTKGKAV